MEEYKGIKIGDQCRLIKSITDNLRPIPSGTEFFIYGFAPSAICGFDNYFFLGYIHASQSIVRAYRNEFELCK